jgi:hypothetical protein
MRLFVYKGFSSEFFEQLDGTPLVEGDISLKIEI